jgi:quinoprotein glucose dehydrogenase
MSDARYPQNILRMLVVVCVAFAGAAHGQTSDTTVPNYEWPNYGNDPGGMRYSPLAQINRENVSTLKVAWIFHTGDISDGSRDRKRSGFEATPILVDGTLYFTTGFNRVIALNPSGHYS